MGPNLVCNVEKKMLKIILKDGMTRWVESQTLKFKLAQDLSQTQWQSKNNFEMKLKMNVHARFLKFSFENHLFFSLVAI
jgi:hypothetical protein